MNTPMHTSTMAARRICSAAFLISASVLFALSSAASEPASNSDDRRATAAIPTSGPDASAWPRFYGGVALEAVRNKDFVSANNDGSLSGISKKETSTAWRLFGGYSFTENLGIEGGYLDLGKSSFTAQSSGGISWSPGKVGTDFEADGWYLEGVVRYPIAPRWTMYARVGAYRWHTKETFFEQSFGTSVDKDSGTNAIYGIGVEYDVGVDNKWVWRGDVMQTKVDHDRDTVNTAGMSLIRKF